MLHRIKQGTTLAEMPAFGTNPGQLKGLVHLPDGLESGQPLVVVLHGCTQNAADYDRGSGWSTLADRHGFALLYPEQQRSNNGNLCFNWFQASDIARDKGEVESIRQMVASLVETQGIDPQRIFVTGLSAGGAMTNALLAAYPDVFSAGAIIAGLPYRSAEGVGEAFERMQGRNGPDAARLQANLRQASPGTGRWPRVSVWHGSHDHTVRPRNADQIVEQWMEVHAVGDETGEAGKLGRHSHRIWRDAAGHAAIESYTIHGMAHGVPLMTAAGEPLGSPAPYMLEAGISSTARIANFFGLIDNAAVERAETQGATATNRNRTVAPNTTKERTPVRSKASTSPAPAHTSRLAEVEQHIGKVIHDALKAAGLTK